MEQRSTNFMTLLTAFGMLISIIISLFLLFGVRNYLAWIPFIFIGLSVLFRCIGYGMDRIVDKGQVKKRRK